MSRSRAEGIYADLPKAGNHLEPIPDKLYFTIGEVGKLCEVPAHVLRYWERKVPGLSKVARRNNRRYYRREDVVKARRIRTLIYDRGMTIQGAVQALDAPDEALAQQVHSKVNFAGTQRGEALSEVCEALKEVSNLLAKGL